MSSLIHIFDDNKFYTRLILLILIELGNFYLLESPLNIMITAIEVVVVMSLMIRKDYPSALIFHVIFCLTGCDATSASSDAQLFSYPEIKLIGPLTLSYILLGMLWLANRKKTIQAPKDSLLWGVRKLMSFFLIYGTGLGVLGLLIFNYRLNDFITAFIYIFVGYLYVDIFSRNYDDNYLHKCKNAAMSLLLTAPIVSFISYFLLNIRVSYSVFDALVFNEEFIMGAILILILFTDVKYKVAYMVSLTLYIVCLVIAGRGGFFLSLLICFLVLIYFTYFVPNSILKYTKYLRIIFPIFIIVGGSAIVSFFLSIEGGQSLAGNKVMELISLLEALFTIGSTGFTLTDISDSPYIRVAEVLNILDNGIRDPLGLIFGHGFGGVYTDSTGLFRNVDVSIGGFPLEIINSGRYGTAHSFLPNTLLFNGLIGTYMLLKKGFMYLKNIKYSPLCFAGYFLFLYSFYFNTSLFLAAAFALYAAEYDIKKYSNVNN